MIPARSIIEFLEARIAEDEAVARAAGPARWTSWVEHRDGAGGDNFIYSDEDQQLDIYPTMYQPTPDARGWLAKREAIQDHMAAWNPARALAECAAKRAMLADLVQCYGSGDMCSPQAPEDIDSVVCMARVYLHHPDYNHAWSDAS